MKSDKIYYLETNALYSLVNYFDLVTKKVEAHTSLLAMEEIVSQISEEDYYQRKSILTKLIASKLKIMPYSPKEMIMAAFGIDISHLDKILEEKKYLYEKIKLITRCESYEKYKEQVLKLYNIDITEEKRIEDQYDLETTERLKEEVYKEIKIVKERRKKEKEICKKYGVQRLSELLNHKKIEGVEYFEIDVNKVFGFNNATLECGEDARRERMLLTGILDSLKIEYSEEDVNDLIIKREKEKLCAFLLGSSFYQFTEIYHGKTPKRNDWVDIIHLIYLENENYVIVSDDKIYNDVTMETMRVNLQEFIKLCR